MDLLDSKKSSALSVGVTFRYFTAGEFACPCCGMINVDIDLVKRLDIARHFAGVPFAINSACRCKAHNTAVGGKPNSSHLAGQAADIRVGSSHERFLILRGLLKAGFSRIGIYQTFIHADIDPTKPNEIAFLGGKK